MTLSLPKLTITNIPISSSLILLNNHLHNPLIRPISPNTTNNFFTLKLTILIL